MPGLSNMTGTDTDPPTDNPRDAKDASPKAFKGTQDKAGRGAQVAASAGQESKRRWRPFRTLRHRTVGGIAAVLADTASYLPTPLISSLLRGLLGAGIGWTQGGAIRQRLREAFAGELTEDQVRRIARGVPRSVADTVADALAVYRGGERWLANRIDTTESDAWLATHREALSKGFVGITAHCGNWELTARWVATEFPGVFTHVVGKRAPNKYLNNLIERYRHRVTHCQVLYRDVPPATFSRLLKDGQAIGFLPDQDVRDLPGLFVDFFGKPAYTPIGPARLAVAAGLPLGGAFLIRTGRSQYRVRMLTEEPLVPDRSRPKKEEMLRITQAYSRGIEAAIRAHPEQWPWFHDRWRTTPEKLASRGRTRLEL